MKTIQGPGIFLAQFAGDQHPFNTLDSICRWAAELGYKGVQIPSWDGRLFDLEKAANSKSYCEEVLGTIESHGLKLTELSTHLQGQLVAVHPAYDLLFDGFPPASVHNAPAARTEWAIGQLNFAAKASRGDGGRSSMCLKRTAWISATRFIPARTCTTGRRSRCSWIAWVATRDVTYSTIRAISFCNSSTIWSTSTCITNASRCFT